MKLSDHDVKETMSNKAIISNTKNRNKISKSLHKHFESQYNRDKVSSYVQKKWCDPSYTINVSKGMRKKWEDESYRNNILSQLHMTSMRNSLNPRDKKIVEIKKALDTEGRMYEKDCFYGAYHFHFLIDNTYLIDLDCNDQKKLFIEHYFKDLIYMKDWQ